MIKEFDRAYSILHDDLIMYYNDSLQDTPQDAKADKKDVKKDFALVLPFNHKIANSKETRLDLAYSDFLDATGCDVSLPDDTMDFKADMDNALNNIPLSVNNVD